MRKVKYSLFRQLLSIGVLIVGIIFFSLGILLPKVLLPVYERNIYNYLKQPLDIMNLDSDDEFITLEGADIAYLYITAENKIMVSMNLEDIIKATPKQILKNITESYGKFTYLGKTYYYNTSKNEYVTKIALTNNVYINKIREDILYTIFPILLITLLLITALIILWSRRLILKIEHLKEKVDNLDNDNYVDTKHYNEEDELHALSKAIDAMKVTLKEQDEYKNQMYQNISHDFKTPLTVIKSYIEAMEDGVEDREKAIQVIKEQVKKLEIKVHSLLYLNKLNYMKDLKYYQDKKIDISDILKKSIEKFKIQRPDVSFEIHINDKTTVFRGTEDMWEAIIDNMLNNFIRYAEKNVKVTIKNHRITFYNDGPNIDSNILNDIFTPYKKGIKGQFGLGLSIIKKTLALFNYEIMVKNEKKGDRKSVV